MTQDPNKLSYLEEVWIEVQDEIDYEDNHPQDGEDNNIGNDDDEDTWSEPTIDDDIEIDICLNCGKYKATDSLNENQVCTKPCRNPNEH